MQLFNRGYRLGQGAAACLALAASSCAQGGAGLEVRTSDPQPLRRADHALVVHTLERFAFGPRPAEVERVAAEGLDAWFERQLAAPSAPVPEAYRLATLPPAELIEVLTAGDSVMTPEGGADEAVPVPDAGRSKRKQALKKKLKSLNFKKLAGAYAMAQLSRHVNSEHQLVEVMTDFWTNHFNVFARKGQVKFYAGHYVEHAIRPHVLGKFEDLLIATAQHPAMLNYLDNVKSRAPPTGKALERKRRRDARRAKQGKKATRKRDLNENYARELLELHTVGATHTQADVLGVARVLTGWGAGPLLQGGGFRFDSKLHDQSDKTVLGQTFGPGLKAGVGLLRFLARHPSTGQHLGRKLCQRFVADRPPRDCVSAVASAHTSSGGDIAAMIRTIYRSPSFRANIKSKLKTPLEYLVSALRALDAAPVDAKLARLLHRLGQPVLMMPVPTGYPEEAEAWTGSSAMLQRMNLAAALGRGKLPGAKVDLDRLFAGRTADLTEAVNDQILLGHGDDATLGAIRAHVAGVKSPQQARAIAVTLALGSPSFLRQ